MPTHPTKLVISGVPPGRVANAIIDRYRGQLQRFHLAQQQNFENSVEGTAVHRASQNWGDAQAVYSNVFGQETLLLTVHPSVIEEVRERVEPGYWKWTLVELVVPDMVGFSGGFDLILKTTTNRNDIIRYAGSMPDDEHPDDPPSPDVQDPDHTVSALVDLGDFGGQVVEIEVRGIILSRRIKGGDGHFRDEEGEVVASAMYGARGISNETDGDNLDGDPFGPGALTSAPVLSTLHPDVVIPEDADDTPAEDEARILARLQASFGEWSGVTDYTVAITDHRQSISWLANFGSDLPTRWSFSNPHSNSALATPGVNPNDYNVFPYPTITTTTYWDTDEQFTKTVTVLGYETPFGQFWPIPSPPNVQQYVGDYYTGTDFWVPTWKYEPERTVTITAVSMHHNPWVLTSHRFMDGDPIPGEEELPRNECWRWETANFPERIPMDTVAENLEIAQGDSISDPTVLIGTLKIDTNSGKVTFKAGEGG